MLIKAAAIGVAGVMVLLAIKKNSPETALLLTVAIGVLVTYMALSVVRELTDFVELLADEADIAPAVISPVFKTVGIGILTKLASDVCRDAGQSSIAASVELAGCAAVLIVAIPLMKTVFGMIRGLL